ncbi:hypothetical protein LIER_40261 [Lithospermum erythrorhizon]|uniref:non-specific serine/threonine protein kinase n=1 Tax=Lithospermum erythrorhizon TaxID=34254 RepID=A0AAV3QVA3_LITER
MDNSTEFPPSDELIGDPEDPFLSSSPSPPDASSPAPPDGPSPPSPSSSTSPPDPPEEPPPYNEPSPPKTPETTPSPPSSNVPKTPPTPSQHPPKDLSTSPPSEEPPQNPPPFKITRPPGNPPPVPQSNKADNSPPLPPSDDSNLSGSPPSPSSSGPPPGEVQLIPSPLIFSPPSLSDAPLIPPGAPAHYSSNSVSGKSESDGNFIGTTGVVAIGLVFGLLLLGVIGWTVWWLWHGKKKVGPERPTILHSSPQSGSSLLKMQSSPANSSSEYANDSASDTPGMGNSRNSYSYKELATATNEFSESNQLGEGGFGSVFKGLLPDGREVAVKQLKDGGGQGEREFRAEVDTISRIHHRHLVSLVGYCIFNDKRLLVYDFVPNNTLHFHLHGKGKDILDWPTRIKIATGAARGIAYLHEDCTFLYPLVLMFFHF